jgi:hypothetical protein
MLMSRSLGTIVVKLTPALSLFNRASGLRGAVLVQGDHGIVGWQVPLLASLC